MFGILVLVLFTAGLVFVIWRGRKLPQIHRPILIVLLSLGIVGGLGAAAHGHRTHHERHEAFKQKVADICTESALRVFEQRTPGAITPPAP